MLSMTSFIRNICSGSNKKDQLLFLLDSILINGAYIITTGTLLSGYVIYLGTSDFLTALLNNSANYTTTLSILSFIIFERMSRRKKTLLSLNIASRLLICLAVVLPLLFHTKVLIFTILAIVIIGSNIIWGIYRVGWIVWMMDSLPKDQRSQFVYLRTFLIRFFCSIVTIIAGFTIDFFNKEYIGFLIIFSLSFILSILDIVSLWKIKEPVYEVSNAGKIEYKVFLQPIRNTEFRNYLIFLFMFYLLLTMASSFTPVYLIRYLKFDYKFISTINVLSQITLVVTGLFWSRVERKKGFKFVLGITAFFVAGELLVLSFLRENTYYLLYLSTVIAGIGMGGFAISILTYRYEIMPEGGKTVYEGWYYFASGLGMLISPFAGKAMINYLPEFTNALYQNSKIQLLYLIAFILLCLLLFFTFGKGSKICTKLLKKCSLL